ncbi:MAG: HD domain-containing protein [Candidatus Eisenbacteria bacterium]|uniref:HD domain-containing protein n=1 Tax=Eiseniibacteriota bacterium TaxID=2212470 RepID=A0A849SJV5_UNCEI|nr:HD domain-containing protein [Candidatus Eisenbacteria bacterium]
MNIPPAPPAFAAGPASLGAVLGAISAALDLADGRRPGASLRATLIGMGIGERLSLSAGHMRELYLALLTQNLGATADARLLGASADGDERAAKRARRHDHELEPADAREVSRLRALRSVQLADAMALGVGVSAVLAASDERWDGRGHPGGARGDAIPIGARIVSIARFIDERRANESSAEALGSVGRRVGTQFDPELLPALADLMPWLDRWESADEAALLRLACEAEPGDSPVVASPARLDRIAENLGALVDEKSDFTHGHSRNVADLATRMAWELGLDESQQTDTRRAAWLHDLGMVAVPTGVLDKRGYLTAEEWECVRVHPFHTHHILGNAPGFDRIALAAAAHHERLDGRGYFLGLRGDAIPGISRILAVADSFEALTADRPHRAAVPEEVAMHFLELDQGLDPACIAALRRALGTDDQLRAA